MPTLAWIVVSGIAMSAIALVGSFTLMMPEKTLDRIVLPLVALAAGSLLGGAFFHMLPEAISEIGNDLGVYVWLVVGFLTFFVLEQFLHWHHCHRGISQHRPLGYIILLADGLHNFIGGMAVAAAFLVDIRVGIVTWLVAAAHEVPQELGDFGILVHSGWNRKRALVFNVLSAVTFLIGGLVAYAISRSIDVALLLPFAAGSFVYIAAVDLLPQISAQIELRDKLMQSLAFAVGLVILLAATTLS